MANTSFKVDNGLLVSNNATFQSNVVITGHANVAQTLRVGGDMTVVGNLTYSNTSINGELIPTSNGIALGNTTRTFSVFAGNLNISNSIITANGSTVNLRSDGSVIANATGFHVNASAIGVGVLPISRGGTSASNQNDALNSLLPTQNASVIGYFLKTDGTNSSWTNGIGFTGSRGATGFTGSQGTQGVIGFTGSQGNIGFTGSQGIQGVVGFTGSQGSIGFTGSQGLTGTTGFTGSQGAQGTQGTTGFTGSQGTQGAQGTTGFTGSQGVQGFTGSQGTQGVQGFTGSQGLTGTTGFTGSKGDQGTTGFTGSKGDQGTTGFTGSVGFTGSRGATGFTGSQGAQGVQGFTGSQGLTGTTGFTGSQGTQGVQGFTGSQGTQGIQGFTGSIGFTGSAGTNTIPQSGSDKTTSYTLQTSDVGDFVGIGTGGSITIPDATFATGDAITLYNNTTGNITITCTITTAYIAGTNTDKATMTLATRGLATLLFANSTVVVVIGNVS